MAVWQGGLSGTCLQSKYYKTWIYPSHYAVVWEKQGLKETQS